MLQKGAPSGHSSACNQAASCATLVYHGSRCTARNNFTAQPRSIVVVRPSSQPQEYRVSCYYRIRPCDFLVFCDSVRPVVGRQWSDASHLNTLKNASRGISQTRVCACRTTSRLMSLLWRYSFRKVGCRRRNSRKAPWLLILLPDKSST